MPETLRQSLDRRKSELESELNVMIPHYRAISDFIYPRAAKFLVDDKSNKGKKSHNAIINSTGTSALETLKSGMHAGMTSPARPWFRFTTTDPGLMQFDNVKQWLFDVEAAMRLIFSRSNIYQTYPTAYGSLGAFATAAMSIVEDERKVIRALSFPVGSFMLGLGEDLRVDTICRKFPMTVRQIVVSFGQYDPKTGAAKWDNISQTVRSLWDKSSYEQAIEVAHLIDPNLDRNVMNLDARDKPFRSMYWEAGSNGEAKDKILRQSGFDSFPCMCPRWDVYAEDDVYGANCPGMASLGDIQQLQLMEKRDDEAIEKRVRPPMLGDASLKSQRTSIIPGDITYIDNLAAQQHAGFRPAFQVDPKTAELNQKIARIEQRVRKNFHEDLMLMFAQSDDPTMTAREVEERHQEKLLVLGPTLERLNCELHDQVIDRTFGIMLRRGLIPPPPRELEGQDLKVEYTSIMAQAQKLIGVSSLERTMGFVGNLATNVAAGEGPEGAKRIWRKVNVNHAIEEYASMHGISPKILVSDEDVAAAEQKDAQAAQAAQALAQAAPAAQAAKTLSETNIGDTTALQRLLGA